MRIFYSIFCLIAALILHTSLCGAAPLPLPQEIPGPRLQRNDCVVNEIAPDELFTPYIQEFIFTDKQAGISLYSCVNWRDGFLKSEGIGKQRSRRAAELVARNNALKTLIVLNLDSTSTLQDYFERQKQVRIKIQNVLIKNTEIQDIPADPEKPDEVKVIVTIPFYGISGLVSFFLDDQEIYLEQPTPTKEITPSQEPGTYTGILVDAREITAVEPALFPKLVSEQGEILYAASQVDKDVLVDQGMVEYVLEKEQTTTWRAGETPFIVKPILLVSNGFTDTMPLKKWGLFAEVKTRKSREKRNDLIIKAADSSGDIPVNVVVSVEDAKKIKQLNEEHQFDKQGNYTILIGGKIGGVEGLFPHSLFARLLALKKFNPSMIQHSNLNEN